MRVMVVEIIALCASIVSIALTALLAIWQLKSSKRINDINLEADLLKNIVASCITEEIPTAYLDVCFQNGCLSGTQALQDAITNLMRKVRFFKYYDVDFYNELKEHGQALENYIVENDGKHFDVDECALVTEKISKMITEIYVIIKNKYRNGK